MLRFLAPELCIAQLSDFNVQLLDEGDGIRTSNILKMVRDKNGFLWMLSPRYVQRFDGQNLKRFDVKGEDLLDLAADSNGHIWVSSQSGIQKFVNDYKGFEEVKIDGPLPTKFNVLQISSDNKIWVISGKGLFVCEPDADHFRHFAIPGLENQLFYRKIFQKFNDEFFVGDTHVLSAYNTKTKVLRSISFEAVSAIAAFSADILWVTNSRLQIFEVNFRTQTIIPIAKEKFYPKMTSGFLEINAVVPLNQHKYLVNTSQGCFKYDRSTGIFSKATLFHYGNELANNEIYTSYYDNQGILWLLAQQGIIFFRPNQHTISWLRGYNKEESNWNNNVKAMTGDDDGNIWMATAAGISRLSLKNGQVKSFHPDANSKSTFQFPSVQGLVFDGQNLILGPGAGGLLIFNPKTSAFREPIYPAGHAGAVLRQKTMQDYIYSIVQLANGDNLILGDASCYILEKKSYKIREVVFRGSNFILQTAAQNDLENIWIGTYKGVLYLDKKFKTLSIDTTFKPSRLVTSLLVRNDSIVWAGTVGIYEVTKTRNGLKKKLIISELANQQITMLYKEKNGKIWIGADDGLYRYTESEKKLEWFDIWDNVQNKQLNPGSLYEAKDGVLYLGGNNGLNYFDPKKIESRKQDLNVLITGVTINQDDSLYLLRRTEISKPVVTGKVLQSKFNKEQDDELQLDWNQNSVEIQFVTSYFQNTQKIKYRYRLTGLDTGWVQNGRNTTVRFSSLGPGSYRFTVAASLDGITWNETQHPFSFSISPPFWKRKLFLAFSALFISGGSYYLFRRRISSIRKREAKVYELQNKANSLEKEKALAMYEGLKQQLNPHFLFNSLTSLDSLIFIDQNLASNFLEGLSRTYRYILKNRDNELVPLSDEIRFAQEYVGLQKARFQNGFKVNISVTDDDKHWKIAPVTLQNLIENAIKHNIIADDTPLVIDIYREGEQLVVRNTLQKKKFVETSNRQGLKNLESLYHYLSVKPLEIIENENTFTIKIPLISIRTEI